MVGYEERIDHIRQCPQASKIVLAEPIGRPERHGDTMQCDRVAFAHAFQHLQRPATVDHEVLGNYLHEIDRYGGFTLEKVSIVRLTQSESKLVVLRHMSLVENSGPV